MKVVERTYIIENDSISALLTKRSLEEHPYFGESLVFKNGKMAIEHLAETIEQKQDLPDLVLFDLSASLMNGWEFLEAFVSSHYSSGIPVFVLTSSIHSDDSKQAQMNDNVLGFISKPLDEEKLNAILTLLN